MKEKKRRKKRVAKAAMAAVSKPSSNGQPSKPSKPDAITMIREARSISHAFDSHAAMLASVHPDIDNICCANRAHSPYVREAADARVSVIVLEKPPVVWP